MKENERNFRGCNDNERHPERIQTMIHYALQLTSVFNTTAHRMHKNRPLKSSKYTNASSFMSKLTNVSHYYSFIANDAECAFALNLHYSTYRKGDSIPLLFEDCVPMHSGILISPLHRYTDTISFHRLPCHPPPTPSQYEMLFVCNALS